MLRTFLVTIFLFAITAIAVITMQSCKDKEKAAANKAFEFKETLSSYEFFTGNLKELQPASNVTRYEISTALFTDYTIKDRYIVLPKGTSIKYTDHGALDFPDSTIIIKNFAYTNMAHQKTMIETRLLVKDPLDKKWKVMDYLWNKEQTDAVKYITGAKVPVDLLDDNGKTISTVYQVPNVNDCKRCHMNNGTLTPIGPKARNLNVTVQGQATNQLEQWITQKFLTGINDVSKVEKLPDWKDSTHYSLEQRARAYLDVNCAHCHTQGGDAFNTGLFLEYEQTAKDHIGIMKAPVSAGGGAGGLNYDIVPGDAAHSIFIYRMQSTEPGTAMPELARTIVHKEAVQLIIDWINSMKQLK